MLSFSKYWQIPIWGNEGRPCHDAAVRLHRIGSHLLTNLGFLVFMTTKY
jgi:hypothetical protein